MYKLVSLPKTGFSSGKTDRTCCLLSFYLFMSFKSHSSMLDALMFGLSGYQGSAPKSFGSAQEASHNAFGHNSSSSCF